MVRLNDTTDEISDEALGFSCSAIPVWTVLQMRLQMKLLGFLVQLSLSRRHCRRDFKQSSRIFLYNYLVRTPCRRGIRQGLWKTFSSYFGYLAHCTFKHTDKIEVFCTHESSQFKLWTNKLPLWLFIDKILIQSMKQIFNKRFLKRFIMFVKIETK